MTRIPKTIDDFFRGVRFLTGSAILVGIGLTALVFLGVGIYAAYKTGNLLYLTSGVLLAGLTVGVSGVIAAFLVTVGRRAE